MDPLTLFIIGAVLMALSIPTNSYALAGTSIGFLFFSGVLFCIG